jgi:hypothetical protein
VCTGPPEEARLQQVPRQGQGRQEGGLSNFQAIHARLNNHLSKINEHLTLHKSLKSLNKSLKDKGTEAGAWFGLKCKAGSDSDSDGKGKKGGNKVAKKNVRLRFLRVLYNIIKL